jgi:Leucine-rich repeat (LRR) protein
MNAIHSRMNTRSFGRQADVNQGRSSTFSELIAEDELLNLVTNSPAKNKTMQLTSRRIKDLEFLREYLSEGGVEELYIADNKITDISPLAGSPSLRLINLKYNKLKSLVPFEAGMPNLTKLDIGGTNSFDATPLQHLTSLTDLDVSSNSLSDLSPISHLPLKRLNFDSNLIDDISFIENMVTLEDVVCSRNMISDLSSMRHLKYLIKLDVSKNFIPDITHLKECRVTLRHLNVSCNLIDDIKVLKDFHNLNRLDAYNNKISDISPLYELLTLIQDNLTKNPVSGKLRAKFAERVRMNYINIRLRTLTLSSLAKKALKDIPIVIGIPRNLMPQSFDPLGRYFIGSGVTRRRVVFQS